MSILMESKSDYFFSGLFVGVVIIAIIAIISQTMRESRYDAKIYITEQGYTKVQLVSDGFVAKKDGKDVTGFLRDGVVYITSK